MVGYSSGPAASRLSCGNPTEPFSASVDCAEGTTAGLSPSMESGGAAGRSGTSGIHAFLGRESRRYGESWCIPGDTQRSARESIVPEVVGHSTGSRGTRGFRLDTNRGIEDLGTLPGGDLTRAFAINNLATSSGQL